MDNERRTDYIKMTTMTITVCKMNYPLKDTKQFLLQADLERKSPVDILSVCNNNFGIFVHLEENKYQSQRNNYNEYN